MQVSAVGQTPQYNQSKAQRLGFGAIMKNNLSKIVKVAEQEITDKFVCVVSGPSGVGKDSILNGFDEKYKFFSRVVTCTTRKPRPGEVNGVNYHFLTPDEFRRGIENDEFLEYVNVYSDKFYGTRKKDVEEALETGKNVVMALDVDGAKMVKEKRPSTVLMFFEPPSMKELEARLNNRGTETVDAIRERVKKAAYEMKFRDDYDIIVRNDDLHESIEEVAQIFMAKA